MSKEARPLSELVAQGWEIAGFSAVHGVGYIHSVLLKRQGQHKVIVLSKRSLLGGTGVVEHDV
ncbi:MAG: hypothetical protein JO256_09010 [Alphaproteobacteria bacterium]|nr:hypothetical protein [Alphaproteobacteria bacterium]